MSEQEWTQVLATAAWGDEPLPHWIEEPPPDLGMFITENEWIACDDPRLMLLFVQENATDRKLRLFAVACCREIWDLLPGDDCREKVELAEQFADGKVNQDALDRPYATGYPIGKGLSIDAWRKGYASFACFKAAVKSAWEAATHALTDSTNARGYPDQSRYGVHQVRLVRDIFGNPFRPVTLDPRWLTSNVVDLAQAIYQERAFENMPILADALMDAGCDGEEIIQHCRGDGPHVRGCWVVDLLLGKA